MKISELIAQLQGYMAEGGDREVLLEIQEAYSVNIIGSPKGLFRDGTAALVITSEEIDHPDWIP
jgi:hypothetical protein